MNNKFQFHNKICVSIRNRFIEEDHRVHYSKKSVSKGGSVERIVGGARGEGMARAALAALALAVCARADQYGAGAMPQYGAADYERDYYARSPDAPAPLNYKYQEDPHGGSPLTLL